MRHCPQQGPHARGTKVLHAVYKHAPSVAVARKLPRGVRVWPPVPWVGFSHAVTQFSQTAAGRPTVPLILRSVTCSERVSSHRVRAQPCGTASPPAPLQTPITSPGHRPGFWLQVGFTTASSSVRLLCQSSSRNAETFYLPDCWPVGKQPDGRDATVEGGLSPGLPQISKPSPSGFLWRHN